MLASSVSIAAPWYVMPYTDHVSIQARSTNDVAAYVISCAKEQAKPALINDALVIFDESVTSDEIDVRAGRDADNEPFFVSSAWHIERAEHSATLTPPRGTHLRDFMLDGGSLEIRYTSSAGPQILKFDLADFPSAYKALMHICK